ncbi:MAG: pre-peptidase C-terminal domain-containing protein [Phormidesmis sp.]
MSQPSQDVLRTFGQTYFADLYGETFSLDSLVSRSEESVSTPTPRLSVQGIAADVSGAGSSITDSSIIDSPLTIASFAYGSASAGEYNGAELAIANMRQLDTGDTITTARDSMLSSDNPGTASTVERITRGNDVDFYSVQLDAGDTVNIDIDSSNLDSVLRLFDSAGNEVAFSDDDPAPGESFSLESYLSFTASESDTYFVGVSGFSNTDYNPFSPPSGTGNSTGRYTITVGVTTDNNGGGGSDSDFQIDVLFTDSSLSASQQAIFQDAADRWAEIITGDLPDVFIEGIGEVDDLVIQASAPSIDGVGGTLGQAGPTFIRTDSSLPVAGIMEFDAADLDELEASGQLEAVILHEMGHVLGIGTIWERLGLLTGGFGDNPQFIGAGATAEYNDIFGVSASSVPVENTGGPGTRNGHWRESIFDNELMTGFLNPGSNPLSRMTVASLADLGYEVNLGAADPYAPPTNQFAPLTAADAFDNAVAGVEGVFLGLDAELIMV